MIYRALSGLALCLALTATAQASASCYTSRPGVQFSFGFSIGSKITQSDRNEINLAQLRSMGVDATSVEMWGACIRAFVRKPGGGEEMQLFHPQSFERVD